MAEKEEVEGERTLVLSTHGHKHLLREVSPAPLFLPPLGPPVEFLKILFLRLLL